MWGNVLFAVVAFLFIYYVYFYWKYRKFIAFSSQFKSGLKHIPLLGVSYLFVGSDEDRMKAIEMAGRDCIKRGGLTSVWLGHRPYLVVTDPEIAKIFLHTCLEKDDIMQMCFKMIIGNGSITAPIQIWRPRRKILIPFFNSKNLNQFVKVFADRSQEMVHQLQRPATQGPFSLYKHFSACTLVSIFETTLGININNHVSPNRVFEFMDKGLNILATRGFQPWLYYNFIFKHTSNYKTLLSTKDFINNISTRILTFKRKIMKEQQQKFETTKMPECFKSLLDLLMESSGELGYTDLELKEEFIVLVVAGTDTSAISTSFTILMLSQHSRVQERVYEELKEVFNDSTKLQVAQDLSQLKYMEIVIKETMRLYPSVPIILRKVDKAVILPSGVIVPGSCGVVVNIWALHRNPAYWGVDSEQFRPERFLEDGLKHSAQFMPFSYGPRNCAGSQYAMMVMKTMLATLLLNYKVLPPTSSSKNKHSKPPIRLKFKLLMKDADDFVVALERRK